MKPDIRPQNPCFSSGPCPKRPGWSLDALSNALTGRSHRSAPGKARIQEVCDRTRAILGIPADYRIALVPASDTGAVEMAMWTMLGARGVDMLTWESFGQGWVSDAKSQLDLDDLRVIDAPYGELPDLGQVSPDRDAVFVWNGTTSGVRIPNGDWIAADRTGITICDATSAVFAMTLPWDKLDVTTWSWQKVMGGEGGHGMIVLSPRAVERLESFTPPRALPKIFRMTKGGKLIEGIFKAETINTPSMLCVEDALDALKWFESIGGAKAIVARADGNLALIDRWVARTPWLDFLATKPATRSSTSVCLKLVEPGIVDLPHDRLFALVRAIAARLEKEDAGYDVAGHRDAPPHIRIWAGATVERSDLEALLPWLEWAYETVKNELLEKV